ncbi:hypothetical protein NDU88_005086 [Pleurodeles waltl]|uniref:Uncharacterized protein n=1 Tax=Pleurodeles waltl TaxID=8319 RepID=A0AAV7M892_PLEWA|nr:hypothetical protein NDU88_005086 [Pleurodeles waltl]
MGKTDKTRAKQQFEQCRAPRAREETPSTAKTNQDTTEPEMGTKLRQILTTMQLIFNKIDTKIDSYSYRMDRNLECIDKHAEHLDMAERHVSDIVEERAASAVTRKQLEKSLLLLQVKAEELEGCSRWNN